MLSPATLISIPRFSHSDPKIAPTPEISRKLIEKIDHKASKTEENCKLGIEHTPLSRKWFIR